MSDPTLTTHVTEFSELIRQFRRLRRYARALLPKEVAQANARFEELLQQNPSANTADFDLLYNIGVILSQQDKPITMSELSQVLDVPLSTATRIVDLLVKNNLAQRLSDAEDRRIVRIALTETGTSMYHVIDEFIQQRLNRILQRFSSDERDTFIGLMRRFLAALQDEAEEF